MATQGTYCAKSVDPTSFDAILTGHFRVSHITVGLQSDLSQSRKNSTLPSFKNISEANGFLQQTNDTKATSCIISATSCIITDLFS